MSDIQTVFANLAWYRRNKDLVPLFDPKAHLFDYGPAALVIESQ